MTTKYEQQLINLCEKNNLIFRETFDAVEVATEEPRLFRTNGYHYEWCVLDGSSGLSETAERREAINDLIKAIKGGFIEDTCGNESCHQCYEIDDCGCEWCDYCYEDVEDNNEEELAQR
jgi:hypothetical protein